MNPIILAVIVISSIFALYGIFLLLRMMIPQLKKIPLKWPEQIGSALIFFFMVFFVLFNSKIKDKLTLVILVLTLGYIIYIVVEKILLIYLRKKFKYIIHVNGIRGKSTTTRLIDAGFRGCGYKVFSKTTGTLPTFIDTNNVDHVIKRWGKANIREQIKMMHLAAKEKADVLVLECMAVNPDLQEVCEKQILNADLCVITNVRPDHIHEMGDSLEEIALAFCRTLPNNGKAVIGKNDYMNIFKREALYKNCSIESLINYDEEDTLDTFKENIELALSVGKAFNCNLHDYFEGMKKYHHDMGAFEEIKYQNTILLNGFSINDPISIRMVYDEIIKKYNPNDLSILLNSRIDRPSRAQQHIAMLKELPCKKVLLTGSNIKYIERHLKTELPDKNIIIINNIDEILNEKLVFGIGNIGGEGMEILEYFRNKGEKI